MAGGFGEKALRASSADKMPKTKKRTPSAATDTDTEIPNAPLSRYGGYF